MATDNTNMQQRRIDDHHPATKIDWTKPDAPAVAQPLTDKVSEVQPDYSIRPVKVERNENGWWSHPGIPNFDEDFRSYDAWLKAVGIEVTYKMLESEGDEHPVYVSYFENEEYSFAAWESKPPEGEGWFTFSIHDTEDGPAWVWARRIAAPSTAGSGKPDAGRGERA